MKQPKNNKREMTLRECTSKAGKARAASMTAEERKALGRLAAQARWGKQKAP